MRLMSLLRGEGAAPAAPIMMLAGDGKKYPLASEEAAASFEAAVSAAGGTCQRVVEPAAAPAALSPEVMPAELPKRLTLYDLEEHLAALLDSEDMVPEHMEEEYGLELRAALTATREKRDRVAEFLAYLESQAELADKEIARLEARKAHFCNVTERIKDYVRRTIQALPVDAKGKYKKLEGTTHKLWIQKNPDSVEIANEEAVPAAFKTLRVSMPAEVWESLLDSLDFDFRGQVLDLVKRPECTVSKTAVKEALARGEAVPGTRLVTDSYSVRRN